MQRVFEESHVMDAAHVVAKRPNLHSTRLKPISTRTITGISHGLAYRIDGVDDGTGLDEKCGEPGIIEDSRLHECCASILRARAGHAHARGRT